MKKFLILLVAICCLGCECNHPEKESPKVEIGKPMSTQIGTVYYIDFDGHQYVMWHNTAHRGSMCHSPKCPCLEQYKTK